MVRQCGRQVTGGLVVFSINDAALCDELAQLCRRALKHRELRDTRCEERGDGVHLVARELVRLADLVRKERHERADVRPPGGLHVHKP
jgi:hypothetical protein